MADTEKKMADTEKKMADTEKKMADTEKKMADTGRPPAGSLHRHGEEAQITKSMALLLKSLEDAVRRRPKEVFGFPADSPPADGRI
ncbi:hypothetical protein EYF80_065775 [Liparis tanakae]|uniref:Uncharacterized protein n=1 Tax=Liparis tanakae TaxID=230148 RepID=A0A4Z2E6Z1_9TELE|nr:hypothetical protein EYF80_065775 [Liparis tanakae]